MHLASKPRVCSVEELCGCLSLQNQTSCFFIAKLILPLQACFLFLQLWKKKKNSFLFKALACSCKHSLCRQILLAELFLLAELCKCNSRFVAVPTSASPRRPCGYPGGQSGCSLTPGWQGVNGLVHDTSLKPLASHQAVLTNSDLLGQIRISRLACANDAMYCSSRATRNAMLIAVLYHEKEKKKKIIYIFGLIASLDRRLNE